MVGVKGQKRGRGPGLAFFEEALLRDTNECIHWPYGHASTGYGRLYVGSGREDNRTVDVHVLACERVHGPRPPGMQVAHNVGCRRDCFNPRHLRWDTCGGNLADRVADGTLRWGEAHPRAKLTAEVVSEIRERYGAGGITMAALAQEYKVEQSTIRRAIRGLSWGRL